MVFSPKNQKMICLHCNQLDTHEKKTNESLVTCISCGADITPGEFVSSSKCPYCGTYVIYDERVSDKYQPDVIVPFKLDRDTVFNTLDREFEDRLFTPTKFLTEATYKDLEGKYIPFFLYDFAADGEYLGVGTKERSWRSGDYTYYETSYYDVERVMHAEYENIPADASTEMPDDKMDLLEPYDYHELLSFDPKYLSGFFGEIYNEPSMAYRDRAYKKALSSAKKIMKDSISGYTTLKAKVDKMDVKDKDVEYALFPVWVYNFKWKDKDNKIYVNGQTGKVIGRTPVSKIKVLAYTLSTGIISFACMELLIKILGEVL